MLIGLLLGGAFWKIPKTAPDGLNSRAGLIFFALLFCGLLMNSLHVNSITTSYATHIIMM